MLHRDGIDLREGIDYTKNNNSKECIICHYWFFIHRFKFQDSVCNRCHDLTMLCVNFGDIDIIAVKNVNGISKSEAIN